MSRIGGLYLAVSVVVLLASTEPARAGFYMLMDANGDVSFSDTRPPNMSNKMVVKTFHSRSREKIRRPSSYKFPNSYDNIIISAAKRYGVDPLLVKSVIKVESDFNQNVISNKGAQGLMQLMPATARLLSVNDSFDPKQNIFGGTKYLRRMLERFKGNTKLALAAYNAGPTAVASYGGVPPYKETTRYISKVMSAYTHLSGERYPLDKATTISSAKPKQTVVYKYIGSDGNYYYSDKPMGHRVVLTD